MATGIGIVQFGGELKGIVDFIFSFTLRVFTDESAMMI
jgi:hypothetical protein